MGWLELIKTFFSFISEIKTYINRVGKAQFREQLDQTTKLMVSETMDERLEAAKKLRDLFKSL